MAVDPFVLEEMVCRGADWLEREASNGAVADVLGTAVTGDVFTVTISRSDKAVITNHYQSNNT